jgi:hypothetical protein
VHILKYKIKICKVRWKEWGSYWDSLLMVLAYYWVEF